MRSFIIKKHFIIASLILLLGLFLAPKVNAATLSNVKDTINTSRPSASTPLSADQAASATQVSVVDNGSFFLASDSAVLQLDTGQTANFPVIASMSAQIAGSPATRSVYFTSTAANTHHIGTALVVPVTSTHMIQFTTNTSIPSGGKIVITFPGAGLNTASPSASTFSFNNLVIGSVLCNPTTACGGGGQSVSAPSITLTTTAVQSGGTTIYIAIGCTGTVSAAGICSTYAPALINPTKTAAAGTADTWKISLQTQDASSLTLDTSKALIGTIEAVQVQGTVEPSMTFTIAGVANGASACSDTTNPGPGLDSTATFVNLGSLANGVINVSAQTLTISTNGAGGYAITATSSGRFLNPSSGFWITDANGGNGLTDNNLPAPATFQASGNPVFGIHPCGTDSSTGTWGSGGTAFSSGNKYSNPWNTGVNGYSATIATFAAPASARATTVEYAATVGGTTPAGTYNTVFTYVATPTF